MIAAPSLWGSVPGNPSTMSISRVLVVSGSAGHGHVMAGKAVTEALQQQADQVEVAHLDAVSRMSPAYARTYRWGYVRLVDRHPLLWRMLYEQTDAKTSRVAHALTLWAGKRFVQAVDRWKPAVTVCTHFLALELLARAIERGRIQTRLQAVVTDDDAHRVWAWPGIEHFYVASELVKARFNLDHGVPEEHITVTGVPVRRGFTKRYNVRNLRGVRAELGLDPERPTVVFLSGGFATAQMSKSIVGLWLERRDAQIVAICGRNERLRRRIARLPRPTGATLHALGFVEDVAPLLAAADVVVSKSGGVSTAECMALGKPMVIAHAIAGQEERNALAVVGAGAGVFAPTPAEVRYHVARLLADPKRLAAMARSARALGRPRAADEIAGHVVDSVGPTRSAAGPRFHGAR